MLVKVMHLTKQQIQSERPCSYADWKLLSLCRWLPIFWGLPRTSPQEASAQEMWAHKDKVGWHQEDLSIQSIGSKAKNESNLLQDHRVSGPR